MKKFTFLFLSILLVGCSYDRIKLNEIVENDTVQFPYDFVDLKSIRVYRTDDSVIFEIKVKGLSDTINYSDKNHYAFYISSKLNSNTDLQLGIWNTESDPLEGKKIAYKYLLENCKIKLDKFIRNKDYSITVYHLDSVYGTINKNGWMYFKIKPKLTTDTLINSFKNNLRIKTNYWKKTPSSDDIYFFDYLKAGFNTTCDHRGVDTISD